MADRTTLLDSVRLFRTPEQAVYRYRVAGPLVRVIAFAVDVVATFIALLIVAVLLLLFARAFGFGVSVGAFLVMVFVAQWLAMPLVEWLWSGRSLGKAWMGLRVISAEGLAPSLGACVVRHALRFVDLLPTPLVGMGAMVLSGDFRRLGDLAAGTCVVHNEGQAGLARAVHLHKDAAALAQKLPAECAVLLDAEALRAIARYVAVRARFHPRRRTEMADALAQPLASVLGIACNDSDALLCAVHHALAMQDASGRVAQSTFTHSREADWNALERTVGGFERAFRNADALFAFSRSYRAVCSDLAMAQALHMPAALMDRLHRLVARSYAQLHRSDAISWRGWKQVVLVDVPTRLRGDGCLYAALFAFFGVFALSVGWGLWDSDAPARMLGADTIESFRGMYRDEIARESAQEAASMHGMYILNNVGIAMQCFASGILLGIGSMVVLAFNGVVIGLIFAALIRDAETREFFLTFVVAHGPFELTGIALAGAAGLRMGLGLIDSGSLPRFDGVRRSTQAALPILGVGACLVALAAPIEAWISPSILPTWCKITVGASCAAALVIYLALGGRGALPTKPTPREQRADHAT